MKRNVLIVEDDPTIRVVLKRTLTESNLDVGEIYEAENGKNGLKILDHATDNPKFIYIPAVVATENDDKRIDAILRRGMGFVHNEFTITLLEDQIRQKIKEGEL